jgi:ATPase family associated with various cellular activities (AAA)
MAEELPSVGAFAASFQRFLEAMTAAAEHPDSPIVARLREHLGVDPRELPQTAAEFPTTEHANLQLGLDAVLPEAEVVGVSAAALGFIGVSFGQLFAARHMVGRVELGPIQYSNVEVGDGRVIRCVSLGIYLAEHASAPVALLVSRSESPMGPPSLTIEAISPDADAVSALLDDIRQAMRERNVYRGRIVSLSLAADHRTIEVHFHALPTVEREAVILPEGTLDRLERHARGISERADALRAAGRHLKRGVLLHGPPGTGKTLTVNYLLSAMPGRTTVLLTGRGLSLIEQALAIARQLAPATVVLEDVDLVAAERTMPIGDHGVLFGLLNEMDGLADDEDLLFLLTTNRPDVIEPALVARPGRIDLALECPIPDEAARTGLVHLYARDVQLDETTERQIVERTEGVSGAFIKELMRQAALRGALDERTTPNVADVLAVLDELMDERSALTRRLLGRPAEGTSGEAPAPPPLPSMLHALGAAGLPIPPDLDPG